VAAWTCLDSVLLDLGIRDPAQVEVKCQSKETRCHGDLGGSLSNGVGGVHPRPFLIFPPPEVPSVSLKNRYKHFRQHPANSAGEISENKIFQDFGKGRLKIKGA
jgi:hypothetical protein